MAHREDITQRLREIDPRLPTIIKKINELLKKNGADFSDAVITTDDMTEEEEKLAFLYYYLKQGILPGKAEELAEEHFKKLNYITQLFKTKKEGAFKPPVNFF